MSYLVIIGTFMLSWGLTFLLRRYALAKSVLDVPSARSSHSVPTPRGGGVAIVITVCFGLMVLSLQGLLSVGSCIAYLGAGLCVAAIGFADDHSHIAARWRLAGHAIASAWALYWLHGAAPLVIGPLNLSPGVVSNFLALIYLVWMLNLYNFMDGIDGLASVEAITVCASAALMYGLTGHYILIMLPLLVASAVSGFLLWNFPVARIFMGDAGSGFLGLLLGALALEAAWVDERFFWGWMILLGVFIVDATLTLIRRVVRHEKVYQAHRSHGYQFASRRYGSHKIVTCAVFLINGFWLLPLALIVAAGYIQGPIGVLVGYLPLGILAWRYGAGCKE